MCSVFSRMVYQQVTHSGMEVEDGVVTAVPEAWKRLMTGWVGSNTRCWSLGHLKRVILNCYLELVQCRSCLLSCALLLLTTRVAVCGMCVCITDQGPRSPLCDFTPR